MDGLVCRYKKQDPDRDHFEGQLVWLNHGQASLTRSDQKPLGSVARSSYWPDLWVSVEVWEKAVFADQMNNTPQKKAMSRRLALRAAKRRRRATSTV